MPHGECAAAPHPRHRAVVGDERQRIGQRLDRLEREGITAAGDHDEVHALTGGGSQRFEVLGRHVAAPVEQGAVEVERDEANHPLMRLTNA